MHVHMPAIGGGHDLVPLPTSSGVGLFTLREVVVDGVTSLIAESAPCAPLVWVDGKGGNADGQGAWFLQASWGPRDICPSTLSLSYPDKVAFYTLTSGESFSTCFASSVPSVRKPRGVAWHPSSKLCILAVLDASEILMYSLVKPTSPLLLYRITALTAETPLEAFSWDRAGTTLAVSASGQLRLLTWADVGAVEAGPPAVPSPSRTAVANTTLTLGKDNLLGKARAVVDLNGFGLFAVATECPTMLDGSSTRGPLNTTLAALRESSGAFKRPSSAGIEGTAEVGPSEETKAGEAAGVVDLRGKLGGMQGGSSAVATLLGGGLLTQRPAPITITPTDAPAGPVAQLHVLRQEAKDDKSSAIASATLLSSAPLAGAPIPSLVACQPLGPKAVLVAGSESSDSLIVLTCSYPTASSEGPFAVQVQEGTRLRLPTGYRPRGLALHKSKVLCLAIKREVEARGARTGAVDALGSSSALYSTKLLIFNLPPEAASLLSPRACQQVAPPLPKPPSISAPSDGPGPSAQPGPAKAPGVAETSAILLAIGELREELLGRLDKLERAVEGVNHRLTALEAAASRAK